MELKQLLLLTIHIQRFLQKFLNLPPVQVTCQHLIRQRVMVKMQMPMVVQLHATQLLVFDVCMLQIVHLKGHLSVRTMAYKCLNLNP
ncbi:hypothetical protein BDFB_002836 [Asbolus verrucosus]|uniref:Uncharacterized protein n=1 Tax=Asbolus verrucosus TaxID=1661398 RepID=A0A482WBX0_ASBVE|nr:hypothetical protein BDFB_002836 [Asbolus verrucosus]